MLKSGVSETPSISSPQSPVYQLWEGNTNNAHAEGNVMISSSCGFGGEQQQARLCLVLMHCQQVSWAVGDPVAMGLGP